MKLREMVKSENFAGLEFPHMDAISYAELICNTQERYNEFYGNFISHPNIFYAVLRLRSKQMREGRGQDVTLDELMRLVEDGNMDLLQQKLQELFIQPIPQSYISKILSKKTISEVYDFRYKRPGVNLLRILN